MSWCNVQPMVIMQSERRKPYEKGADTSRRHTRAKNVEAYAQRTLYSHTMIIRFPIEKTGKSRMLHGKARMLTLDSSH